MLAAPRAGSRAAPLIGKLLRRADLTRYASKRAAYSRTLKPIGPVSTSIAVTGMDTTGWSVHRERAQPLESKRESKSIETDSYAVMSMAGSCFEGGMPIADPFAKGGGSVGPRVSIKTL